LATAFDVGCDARLAGKPEAVNPYRPGSSEFYAFKSGYRSVELTWGLDARWPVKPLPEVVSDAADLQRA
jgi:hypothetical protein